MTTRWPPGLAERLLDIDGLRVEGDAARTNMVFLTCVRGDDGDFRQWCFERGLRFGGRNPVRLVTHKDVDEAQVNSAAALIRDYFAQS